MARHVPDLRRKLELLRRYGPYRTTTALAGKLVVAVSTLNGWGTGSFKSAADSVPEKRLSALISLFEQSLPQTLPAEQVQSLVLGRVEALEAAFRAGTKVLLEDILTREARLDTGKVSRRKSVGLVEHDDDSSGDAIPLFKLNERFWLEYATGRSGHLLALQNVQQTWGVVRFADGAVSPKVPAGSVLVPGIHEARLVYIFERNNTGMHRFILLVSPEPFPPVIGQAAASRKSLDWDMLCELARYYEELPKHRREVHLVKVHIE